MPARAPHYCTGCHQQTTNTGQCPECKAIGDRKRWAQVDAARPTASARGYGNQWAQTSKRFLRQHPTCVDCGQPATVTDHIIARIDLIAAGATDPDAPHRLQPLCDDCHRVKTRHEIIERTRQRNM